MPTKAQPTDRGFRSGEYPITRRLFVIVKQNGQTEQAGIAYANLLLTNQGQELHTNLIYQHPRC